MSQPSRRRLPWEKDPADREANYRRPIAQSEKIRLTIKAAAVVAGFLFIMSATRDRTDVGAEFAIGAGGPLLVAGILDVLWTIRGRLEHVFIESRPMQLASHSGMAAVGAALVIAGLVAKGT
jgi:hypothetical protein